MCHPLFEHITGEKLNFSRALSHMSFNDVNTVLDQQVYIFNFLQQQRSIVCNTLRLGVLVGGIVHTVLGTLLVSDQNAPSAICDVI